MAKNIVWLYPKLEKWMGGTKFVYECSKLIANEYPLKVITQKGTEEVLLKFKEQGIDVCNLDSLSFTDFSFWLNFKKVIRDNIKSIAKSINEESVVISSMYPLNYIASSLGNKHIQIIYEPFSFFYRNDLYKDFDIKTDLFFRIIRKIYSSTDKLATQKADVLLTLSKFEKDNIRNIYSVESEIIYEGVDSNVFYPRDTTNLCRKYDGKIPLMHSTGFDTYKGTDLVMEALPQLKDRLPNFILFITYTRENKHKLISYHKFIRKNKLEENVIFLQFIPLEELPVYYSFAKIYLEPGKGRSMSLSNKEAMACGTPVIRGNDSEEEVIDGYNGYLVSPDKPKDLAEAIIKIVTNMRLRDEMSLNAISLVHEKFNWNSVVNKIKKHF